MLLAALLSLFYKDGATLNLFLAGMSVLVFGAISMLCTKNHTKEMNKREGYLVVAFGWIVMTSFTPIGGSKPQPKRNTSYQFFGFDAF